jgi:peroxiredoxin
MRARSGTIVLIALLMSCTLIVILGQRLGSLSKAYLEVRRLATTLHTGSVVPSFRTVTLSGDSLTIGDAPDTAMRQVLFVLNTTCPYCEATLPVWAKMGDSLPKLQPGRIRVAGISLDSLRQTVAYVAEHRIGYPMLLFPEYRMKRLYRAQTVPQTLVLDGNGTVLYAHIGVLKDPAVIDSVYRATAPKPVWPSSSASSRQRAAQDRVVVSRLTP